MKKVLIPFGLFLITLPVFMAFSLKPFPASSVTNGLKAAEGIQFENESWANTLAKAKKENRLIFLDGYTSWCEPCKMLRETTFKDEQVAGLFNKNFINVSIDLEKGDGPALSKKYNVTGYPTLLVVNPNGDVVTESIGYLSAKQLIKFGNHALSLNKSQF